MTSSVVVAGRRPGGTRWFYAGWAGVAVFGALVLAARGMRELLFSVALAVTAAALCAWYRSRASRASLVVALVLAALFSLEQVAYLVADLGEEGGPSSGTTLLDLFGLLAGLLAISGAAAGLRSRGSAAR